MLDRMPNRMSKACQIDCQNMSDRMPNNMLDCMSTSISVGGDHSKKVIYRFLGRGNTGSERDQNKMPSVPQPT